MVAATYPVRDLVPSGDFGYLVNVITATIAPDTWSEVGGPGEIGVAPRTRSLMVRQTMPVHHDLARLLGLLRQAR